MHPGGVAILLIKVASCYRNQDISYTVWWSTCLVENLILFKWIKTRWKLTSQPVSFLTTIFLTKNDNSHATVVFRYQAHKLTSSQIEKLYPKIHKFREICRQLDPQGMFRNDYVEKVIFGPSQKSEAGNMKIVNKRKLSGDRLSVNHVSPGQWHFYHPCFTETSLLGKLSGG